MKECDTMEKIIISFENGIKKEYKKGIKLFEIIDDIKEFFKLFKEDLKEWIEDNHYVLDDNRICTQVTK